MSTKLKRFIKISLVILGLCIFLLLLILLNRDLLTNFDSSIYNYIIKYKSNYLTSFFKFITFFASQYWFIFIVIIFYLFNKNKKLNITMTIYLIVLLLITLLLKNTIVRDRPFDLMIVKEYGYSFPSGHSVFSMAFYGLIAYIVYKSKNTRINRFILMFLNLIVILLIGISRIYLGVHYPSDVLAGFMIGIIYLVLFITLYKVIRKEELL